MGTIREKGPAQWHVQIRRKGWPNQTRTFTTKKEAEAWERAVESQMDRGVFVDQTAAERTTLADVIRRYLDEVTAKRPSEASRDAERARLERFLREEKALCAFAMANLRPEHFEEYRDRRVTQVVSRGKAGGRGQYRPPAQEPVKLRKDGSPRKNAAKPKPPPKPPKLIEPGTVKRELTALKRAIDHSKRRLGLVTNPLNTEDVKRPVVNDGRDVRLDHDETERLLAACRDSRNPWLAPVVELAFETGARRSSLLALLWGDVDLIDRCATLRSVKNSRNPGERLDQTIGLTPRAIEILKALPRSANDRVFPTTVNAIACAFDRARMRAGLEHFHFHDARHEQASSLIEAGWSDTQVMAQMGHRDPKSLKRYVNLRRQFLGKALADLPGRRKNVDAHDDLMPGGATDVEGRRNGG